MSFGLLDLLAVKGSLVMTTHKRNRFTVAPLFLSHIRSWAGAGDRPRVPDDVRGVPGSLASWGPYQTDAQSAPRRNRVKSVARRKRQLVCSVWLHAIWCQAQPPSEVDW